jgi:hypothetical protein
MPVLVAAAVEGVIDEAVLRRLVALAGGNLVRVYAGNGKAAVLKNLSGYNNAARFAPWVVLVDLGDDDDCAPPCRHRWLPEPAPLMCLRIAVRAVEAWLLADRERIAEFLRVHPAQVPADPESLPDPKNALIDLARQSRSSRVRADLVPRPESGRRVGPLYASRLAAFVQDGESGWRPEIAAAAAADSLARCLRALRLLIERASSTAARL